MSAIAEIDKSGRIVVPKKLRDQLRLVPGTKIMFDQRPEGLMMTAETKGKGLYRKNGVLVYDGGPVPHDAVDWIRQDREERIEQVGGPWKKR